MPRMQFCECQYVKTTQYTNIQVYILDIVLPLPLTTGQINMTRIEIFLAYNMKVYSVGFHSKNFKINNKRLNPLTSDKTLHVCDGSRVVQLCYSEDRQLFCEILDDLAIAFE